MKATLASTIRAIVFDLDGTLYVSEEFAATIQDEAAACLAETLGIGIGEARQSMAAARQRLTEERGTVQTLSSVCASLGCDIRALHRHFRRHLHPEAYLKPDGRVIALLERLGRRFDLYIYTNNNRTLALRIVSLLGLDGRFREIFSIDDDWRSKPDQAGLERVLRETAVPVAEVLFVGDRYDVDLALPAREGCPVFLCQTIDRLLQLESVVTIHPRKESAK